MKIIKEAYRLICVLLCLLGVQGASAQIIAPLPGRVVVKLTPDYLRPVVYALSSGGATTAGTLLALNATNGTVVNEVVVGLDPTDMAVSPAGDYLYVINAGSRTISKVDLTMFTVVSAQPISTPNSYDPSNPLYLTANNSGTIYFTDGAWGPEIYALDYPSGTETLLLDTGGNQFFGAGGLVLSKNASTLYIWQQYGWGAGNINSSIVSFAVTSESLTTLDSGPNESRDPINTPILLDGGNRWVFNKLQKVAATNVSVLLTTFTDYIYAISLDGTVAFGPTEVFNAQTGLTITNLPFPTAVQALSGDQSTLFRYDSTSSSVVLYNMATIASITGLAIVPTPANGAVVGQAPANLVWSPSATVLFYDVYFGADQAAVASATTASPLYLGRVTNTSIAPGQSLLSGSTYYWRVDTIGFNATNQASPWSFTVSPINISPAQVSVGTIVGYNPSNVSLALTANAPAMWTAQVTGPSWLTLKSSGGATPSTNVLSFNTAAMAAGTYTNNIQFIIGGLKVEVPVTLNIAAMNIVKMAADRVRPYIYAIQPPVLSGQAGTLLFINTTTGNIDKTLPIGINPVDLAINHFENRLYIASWGENLTYVVDLDTQALLPGLSLGTDIYKVNSGILGRIITEGEDQWIAVDIVDTSSGAAVGSFGLQREGDGETDPSGLFYYHCDNNISDARLHKFAITDDSPTEIADSLERPYGTRNLVLSADGSRLFWNGYEYDANLNELGTIGTEIYSCNSDGSVAFGASQAIDGATRLVIYDLPVASDVSIVDGHNKNFWYFDGINGTLGAIPMNVIESPSITMQPAAATGVPLGGAVYLTVTAMGISPLSYQWTLAGTNLPGATNYFLSLPVVQISQQGSYRAIVSNPFGSVTSLVANVTVLTPPAVTYQSPSTHVAAGQPISLSVAVSGSGPLSYSWLFQNVAIGGANSSNLVINNAQESNEGIYRAVVTNSVGSTMSALISVRVDPAGPTIVSNPLSRTLPASSNATFVVTAAGSQPLAYQWFFDNAPIAGASSAQYSLGGVQSGNGGDYYVIVSNSKGSVTSTVAKLTVTALAPYFTAQPADASVIGGGSHTFIGLANGSLPITYQWQHTSNNIPGATRPSLTLTNLTFRDGGPYVLIASNEAGVTSSRVAQLTVYRPPTLTGALTNSIIDSGGSVVLSVQVLGSPNLIYTWHLNGQPLVGSTSTLAVTNIQPSQSGYYSVTVTNAFGSVSSTGRVSVLAPVSTLSGWGDNSGGQLDIPPNLADLVAAAGGDYHTVVLRHDGTLLAWGFDGYGQTNVPTNALPFVTIASGTDHSLAITESGSLVAWGRNDLGQCSIPAGASNAALAAAAGNSHSLALSGSGLVTAWGDNSFGQLNVPKGLSGVIAIASGRDHCLALSANGTVVGWGYNDYGQASPPANLSKVIAIAGGYLHSVALLSNETVVAWGNDSFGQTDVPPGLTNVVAIAATDFDTFALLADGRIVSWGDNSYGQTNVPGNLNNAIGVISGNYDGFALQQTLGIPSMNLSPSGLVLTWSGNATLQSAPAVTGPFSDVPSTGSRYTDTLTKGSQKFFRLRR